MISVFRFLSFAIAMLAMQGASVSARCVPCGGCSDPCRTAPAVVSTGCGGAVGCGQGYVVSNAMPYTAPAVSYPSSSHSYGPSTSVSSMPAAQTLCEPITSYRVVMKPKYVTESKAVAVQETRSETRFRTKTIYKTVPVVEERYRTKMVNVPKTDTKTVSYTVLVPVKNEKTVQITETVPTWSEEPENFTVRVPSLVDVPEEYTVKVPKLRDETFTYTVNVPHPVTEQKTRTVTNAVPVTKTRTISVSVPKTEMKTVTKDYGHWEEQIIEVAAPVASTVAYSSGCGCGSSHQHSSHVVSSCGCASTRPCASASRCGSVSRCASSCGSTACGGHSTASYGGCGGGVSYSTPATTSYASATTTQIKRVWVPNVQTETIPVTTTAQESQVVSYTVYEQQATEVPYECTTLVYRSETRSGVKKVVDYVDETRTRMRKQVQYNEETRTRMRKTLTFNTVTKTETIPYVTYTTEERTKEVSYTYNVPEYTVEPYQTTRYERVAEEQVEEYTVSVPYTVMKEQKVQVCKMIPTLVEETVTHCTSSNVSTGITSGSSIDVGPSVIQGGYGIQGGNGCGAPVMMSAPNFSSGCGGCGGTVSASPCHGC